jgi:hypothetical protein
MGRMVQPHPVGHQHHRVFSDQSCPNPHYGGLARAVMDKFRYSDSEPSEPLHHAGRGQIFAPGTIQMRWASSGSSATGRRGGFRPALGGSTLWTAGAWVVWGGWRQLP